jgi:hypothetical protein
MIPTRDHESDVLADIIVMGPTVKDGREEPNKLVYKAW